MLNHEEPRGALRKMQFYEAYVMRRGSTDLISTQYNSESSAQPCTQGWQQSSRPGGLAVLQCMFFGFLGQEDVGVFSSSPWTVLPSWPAYSCRAYLDQDVT